MILESWNIQGITWHFFHHISRSKNKCVLSSDSDSILFFFHWYMYNSYLYPFCKIKALAIFCDCESTHTHIYILEKHYEYFCMYKSTNIRKIVWIPGEGCVLFCRMCPCILLRWFGDHMMTPFWTVAWKTWRNLSLIASWQLTLENP